MQGTAALNLVMLGRGATPEDAIVGSAVAGPFTVRFAVLNGIKLGLAATQGVAALAGALLDKSFECLADGGIFIRGERFEPNRGAYDKFKFEGGSESDKEHMGQGGVFATFGNKLTAESGFIYHRAKASLMPLAVLPWITYLALPISVHPLLILLPSAALLGLAVSLTAGSFKKYL